MRVIIVVLSLLLGGVCHAQTWLSFAAANGYVDIGDLDVPGNQLTVEALFTSTSGASVDLVSKHSAPPDVNYLLRENHAEMTTSSGFNFTPSVCPVDQNTCRHAAMVYDGVNLKFYLNGQLNGQIAFTGNLVQNNFETLIGNYGCCFSGEQFYGYIDEVRIWNIARTQAEIQTFMFSSLPTPTTQTGLLAYYSFSSTINLQGNPMWDGFAGGTAVIGDVNPFCGALSPVCAILGGNFGRFTAELQGDGLQLDWSWNGDAPQYFELHTGHDPQQLQFAQRLDAQAADAWLAAVPTAPTWLQMQAVGANGEVTRSNIVEFVPSADQSGFALLPDHDRVRVRILRPMQVHYRIVDVAGRALAQAELSATADFEIAMPDHAAGVLIVQVTGDGVTKATKCLR